jgi:DNA-binding Lrp family transcriptional regulator
MKLDEKDESILSMLRQDSRASNVDIGRAVGLTEGAVRSRIRKLSGGGVIVRFTIEVSERGGACHAVVMVKAKGTTKKMMSEISTLSLHKDAYEIAGEYDGCVILDGQTMDELDSKIDSIRKLKSVADTKTYVSFKRW